MTRMVNVVLILCEKVYDRVIGVRVLEKGHPAPEEPGEARHKLMESGKGGKDRPNVSYRASVLEQAWGGEN